MKDIVASGGRGRQRGPVRFNPALAFEGAALSATGRKKKSGEVTDVRHE